MVSTIYIDIQGLVQYR